MTRLPSFLGFVALLILSVSAEAEERAGVVPGATTGAAGQKSRVDKALWELPVPAFGKLKPGESGQDPKIGEWLAEHAAAGVMVHQAKDPKTGYFRGTVEMGGLTYQMGDTPPGYRLGIQTAGGPVLIAERTEREGFCRSIDTVTAFLGRLSWHEEVSVTVPWTAEVGGFAFRRQAKRIEEVGVIIPKMPAPTTPELLRSKVSLRFGWPSAEIDFGRYPPLKEEVLDEKLVIVGNPQTTPLPHTAYIVWMKVGAGGALEVPREFREREGGRRGSEGRASGAEGRGQGSGVRGQGSGIRE